MIKTLAIPHVILLVAGLCLAAPTDNQFEKILDRYFEIQATLATDSTEGIDAASQAIDRLAAGVKTNESEIQGLATSVRKAAQEIQGKNLEAARLSFFELSKPILAYLHQFYKGEKEYFRYYCSMAKKGWIQSEEGTKNPYYGSSMLTCGELIR
jgi:Cu(I)/Ag(I) efflux system membrane fusion protein